MLVRSYVPQLSSRARRSTALVGESLREIGVLILVFAPLDAVVQGNRLTVPFVITTIVLAVFPIGVGIFLEVDHE